MGLPKTKPDLPVEEDFEENFDDEAATVVIDFNKLKAELNSTSAIEEDIPIEFSAHSTSANIDSSALKTPLDIEDIDQIDDEEDKTEVFSADMTASLISGIDDITEPEAVKKIPAILFDLKGSDLQDIYASFNQDTESFDFKVISQLGELNKLIKLKEEMIVVFYYNQNPKAINTLMGQMNSKFKHIKTMIIAKNLSNQKAQMHKKTPAGADIYLSTPQSFNDVIEKLKTLS